MNKSIPDILKEIQESKHLPLEEIKSIEPILRENCNKCVEQFFKFYLAGITTVIAWFLIFSSKIDKVVILDMEINDKNILLISLPLIAALLFYRASSLFGIYQLIDSALKEIYVKLFPNFGHTTIVYFLEFPSFTTFENIKADLTNESFSSMVGLFLSVLVLTILPIGLIIWIAIKLSTFFWFNWYMIIPILLAIMAIKLISDLLFFFKNL